MIGKYGMLVLIFVSMQFGSWQETGQKDSTHMPSKPQNETAGPFDISNGITSAEKDQIRSKIRSFLWDHLREMRPAQLLVTVYTIEGEPTTYTFFIERDEKGHWGIRADCVFLRRDYPSKKMKRETGKESYCEIDRIDPVSRQVIPNDQERSPDEFRLRLITCIGKADHTW
jgi:hypothetical protein